MEKKKALESTNGVMVGFMKDSGKTESKMAKAALKWKKMNLKDDGKMEL